MTVTSDALGVWLAIGASIGSRLRAAIQHSAYRAWNIGVALRIGWPGVTRQNKNRGRGGVWLFSEYY